MAQKKKKTVGDKKITNKRARFDYELGDSFLVGIELNGRETKALRIGHGQLSGSYVAVKNDEIYLLNCSIHGTRNIPIAEEEITRTRKLLAKRREIDLLIAAKQQGKTIVPTEMLTRTRYIKLRISVGKGKKKYDKRQTLKKRDDELRASRDIRGALR